MAASSATGAYSLWRDAAGNLYGTMTEGGTYGAGMVFELSPSGGGAWTETVLWSFGNGSDGQFPESGVIMDAAGNLYGTTRHWRHLLPVAGQFTSCLPVRAATGAKPCCTTLMATTDRNLGTA